ncbi:MAG: M14 family zinc carboxypeptidase, partial [Rhodothermales bacterium]
EGQFVLEEIDAIVRSVGDSFSTNAAFIGELETDQAKLPEHVRPTKIGESEEGRPIIGVVAGRGALRISIIAGNHADEPVGPEMARALIRHIFRTAGSSRLLEQCTLAVILHTNPDGEHRNRLWQSQWPSVRSYLEHVAREEPGRDLEFGFPDMRQENRVVSRFLDDFGPPDLHLSLHGMAFSEGAMLLINRHWAAHSGSLRRHFREAAAESGLQMHDHNRMGEKGFFYIEPGFWTTPEGSAMRAHFRLIHEPEMAERFRLSSMEYVERSENHPLCLVTELPLFLVSDRRNAPAGVPATYLDFRHNLLEWKASGRRAEELDDLVARFGLQPLPVATAVRLQLVALAAAVQLLVARM